MDKYKYQSFLSYSFFSQDILCEYFQSLFLDIQLLVEFHFHSIYQSFNHFNYSHIVSNQISTFQTQNYTMASYMKTLAITALLTSSATIAAAQSGSGTTTRYWYIPPPKFSPQQEPI